MAYYEIIYENGEHSIANYDSDEEALSAINEHVRRAKAGESGTPQSTPRNDVPETPAANATWAAQRVVKVLKYDQHPADYADSANALSVEVAEKTVAALAKEIADDNGIVNMQELAIAVSNSTSPSVDSKPHDSNYKMKETGELKGVHT